MTKELETLETLQKNVSLKIGFYQSIQLIRLLENDIKDNKHFLDNKEHMTDMDNLNPNIRKNMEYSILNAQNLINQLQVIQKSL